jgi:hypothetical protein
LVYITPHYDLLWLVMEYENEHGQLPPSDLRVSIKILIATPLQFHGVSNINISFRIKCFSFVINATTILYIKKVRRTTATSITIIFTNPIN